jgi:hypothetical protein
MRNEMFVVPFQGVDRVIRQCILRKARFLARNQRSMHVDLCCYCVSYECLWVRINLKFVTSVRSQHKSHYSLSVSYSGVLLSFYSEQVYEGNTK